MACVNSSSLPETTRVWGPQERASLEMISLPEIERRNFASYRSTIFQPYVVL
jgi:hypothetical protein